MFRCLLLLLHEFIRKSTTFTSAESLETFKSDPKVTVLAEL